MRQLRLLLLSIFITINICTTIAQNTNWGKYDVNDPTVLVQSQNYSLTQGLFNKGLRFSEFLLGTKFTNEEIQQGLQESITGFQANPQQTIEETEQVDAQMQMLYQLNDPIQIGLARSAIICQLYAAFQQTTEQPMLRQLMDKYTSVLAYDPPNLLAFTEQDFQAYLELIIFNYRFYGQEVYFDEPTTNQYRQYFVNQFLQGTVDTRKSLCVMSELGPYIIASYQNLNEQQQQNVQASFYQQNISQQSTPQDEYTRDEYGNIDYTNPENIEKMWPPGVNTKEEKQAYLAKRAGEIQSWNTGINIMSNMNLETHTTMLNVINNMGGGDGSYWEVKYNDW